MLAVLYKFYCVRNLLLIFIVLMQRIILISKEINNLERVVHSSEIIPYFILERSSLLTACRFASPPHTWSYS